jgi:hypothetical protein
VVLFRTRAAKRTHLRHLQGSSSRLWWETYPQPPGTPYLTNWLTTPQSVVNIVFNQLVE